jgi:AraC-like DNA-binding protein/mannose-6-phosphate isomerase-like protein (cupin superfamily)
MENKMMHEQLTINEQYPVIARHYDYERFTYPWHFHREYEIIYFAEGDGERFVADNLESIHPGDIILMGSDVPHYMRSAEKYYAGDTTLRIKGTIIQFAHDYMSHAIGNYTDLKHIKSFLETAKRGIHFPYPANAEIIESVTALPAHTGVERITNLLLLLNRMAHLKSKRILGSPHFSNYLAPFSDSRIEKILAHLNRHYTENLRLDDIASMVSMNTSAFCRFFKEKSGKPFTEYIQALRVGYACKLLIGSSLDVLQISVECGYNTPSHFNKIFKRNTGFTPSDYRKQFLK